MHLLFCASVIDFEGQTWEKGLFYVYFNTNCRYVPKTSRMNIEYLLVSLAINIIHKQILYKANIDFVIRGDYSQKNLTIFFL